MIKYVRNLVRLIQAKLYDKVSEITKTTNPRFFETHKLATQELERAFRKEDKAEYEEAFNRVYLNVDAELKLNQRKYQGLTDLIEKDPSAKDEFLGLLDRFKSRIVLHETELKRLETELAPNVVSKGFL